MRLGHGAGGPAGGMDELLRKDRKDDNDNPEAVEELEVGDEVRLEGGRKMKIATEDDLARFRKGEEAGESLEDVMAKLAETYTTKYALPDEASLRSDLQKPENIAKVMQGETRPEVYIVVRSSEEGEEGKYTRILLRLEGDHYKVQDNEFSHQTSSHLQPKDKLILAEGGPSGVK